MYRVYWTVGFQAREQYFATKEEKDYFCKNLTNRKIEYGVQKTA